MIAHLKAPKRGASLLGYGLMIGLVSVVALLAITESGSSVRFLFADVSDTLGDVATNAGGGAGDEGGLALAAQVPDPNATGVGVTTIPSVTFSQAIAVSGGTDLSTAIGLDCGGSPLGFTAQISNDTLQLQPDTGLSGGASCTITIPGGAIEALADGTQFGGTSWSFDTTAGGNAYGWGWQFRQALGNSSSSDQSVPTLVEGGRSYAAVAAGYNHSCAIEAGSGDAYCWGFGSSGQLGAGNNNSQQLATAVTGGISFNAITGGGEHSCGISGTTGYCWGKNTDRQIGNGSSSNVNTPTTISGGHSWAMIDAGHNHSCGVTSGGDGYCWGNGGSGRLGNGSTSTRSTPFIVSGGHSWSMISAGGNHSCGVTTGGDAYCWGDGGAGRLGNGSTSSSNTPTLVLGGHTWRSISADGAHTCGVTTSGDGYCWGNGGAGRLGTGNTSQQTQPAAVLGGLNFDAIAAGGSHSCGTVGSTAYCWGNGSNGRIGNASFSQQTQPVQITSQAISQVITGQAHTIGIE